MTLHNDPIRKNEVVTFSNILVTSSTSNSFTGVTSECKPSQVDPGIFTTVNLDGTITIKEVIEKGSPNSTVEAKAQLEAITSTEYRSDNKAKYTNNYMYLCI